MTAFQSVPSDERLSPAPSLTLGRLSSMDSDMAQAIQLSLAGQPTVGAFFMFVLGICITYNENNNNMMNIIVNIHALIGEEPCCMLAITNRPAHHQ